MISEILDFEKFLALSVENAAALSTIHEVVLFFLFMTTGLSLITLLFPLSITMLCFDLLSLSVFKKVRSDKNTDFGVYPRWRSHETLNRHQFNFKEENSFGNKLPTIS